jgi:hypothetical protein
MGPVVAVAAGREAQRLEALTAGNRVRSAGAAVKREVAAGELGVVEALDDPRAARLTVAALLMSVRGVAQKKTRRVLLLARVGGSRRVGELTQRERVALLAVLGEVGALRRSVERAA